MALPLVMLGLSLGVSSVAKIDPFVNCTLEWHTQTLDHFAYSSATYDKTFKQRVFVCGEDKWNPGQPIFFYCGNEANVELYVRHTGLMWENQEAFNAVLVFAEHRYYGESLPFGNQSLKGTNIAWMNHEQALGDYAEVLRWFKETRKAETSKAVAFGGSYGGMLASWMRMKYPTSIVGSIAASAPIYGFPGSGLGSWNEVGPDFGQGFWEVVTRDATPAAGARLNCDSAVRQAFAAVFEKAKTTAGRAQLQKIFHTCTAPDSAHQVEALAFLLMYAWDMMSMGNYPYPSDYITNGGPILPAFPVRVACEKMVDAGGVVEKNADLLLARLAQAADLFNNATKKIQCYDVTDPDLEHDPQWDFQFCTNMLCQETYYGRDGVRDMFWKYEFNMTFVQEHCQKKWGIQPRPFWIATQYGPIQSVGNYSNIVFSNGAYDPWIAGGMTKNVSDTVVAYIVEEGAHHLDLMFSNPQDPQSVKDARAFELANIRKWLS